MGGALPGMAMAGNALMGGPGNSLMMGNALNSMGMGGVVPSNQPLSLNNFSMMGGGLQGVGAGNIMSTGNTALNEANLLREQQMQQSMLAQLQQAHASALTTNPGLSPSVGGVAGSSGVGIPQAAQNKFNAGMGNNGTNTGLLTNDQGNVYTNASNNLSDWNNSADASTAAAQFLQQATSAGLTGGNFPQGMGVGGASGSGAPCDANNFTRIDSAANLRALINQQISMFNTTSSPVDFSSSMGMPASTGGMVPNQGTSSQQQQQQQQQQAAQGLSSIPAGNGAQGLSYEWNEMIQRMGAGTGSTGVDNASAGVVNASNPLRQLEQQLLQSSNHGAPGPASATGAQAFNFNGFFGAGGGGGANGTQGYMA